MIIVKFIGGLGNQMFQYAFFKRLVESSKQIVKADVLGFNNYELHNGFELENIFKISVGKANLKEINQTTDIYRNVFLRLKKRLFGIKLNHIKEEQYVFNERFKGNIYLDGYWQSEKFFPADKQEMRNSFEFKNTLTNKNFEISEEIKAVTSISVHIRRKDYVNNKVYYQCDAQYYNKAIMYMREKIENPKFYIFSDDIQWVIDNLEFIRDVQFVNHNFGLESYVDMQLMSLCKHNIIANSSFSWWGAWLNQNPEKIVIVPPKWYNDTEKDNNSEMIPKPWIKVNEPNNVLDSHKFNQSSLEVKFN